MDMKEELRANLLSLLLNKPFFGYILSKMNLIESKQSGFPNLPTAATDGKNIYFNTEFFKGLDPKERTFVLAHEVMHCVLDSLGRRYDRDPQYWNMATDYVINDVLIQEGIGTMPKVGLHNAKYRGQIAEEVYDDLVKNKAAKKETLDVHFDPKDMKKGDKGEQGSDGDQSGEELSAGEQAALQKEMDENAKEMRETILAAMQHAKMAGQGAGSAEFLIDGLINPRINWRQLLHISLQSTFKDDITWTKPNRRNPMRSMILPALGHQDTVDLCVSIDTSGSITDEQRIMFLSEIVGILDYFKSFKLRLWCFDTEVHNMKVYDQHNINELPEYKPAGGGGTDIKCNFEFMIENDIKPKQFVVLTDGYNYNDNWGPEEYCPTTWIIHSNPKPNVPWGRWAIFEDLTR